MLLAVARLPQVPDALDRAAAACGLARADVQRRLAGVLPRILMTSVDREVIHGAEAALGAAGFLAFAFDPGTAPGDDERVVARALEFLPGELVVVEGVGAAARHRLPAAAISFLQRGARISTTSETTSTRERKLSLSSAVLTGGLKVTKKVERTITETTESRERFLLVHRSDGERDVILYERRLDYRFLGDGLAPASHANLEQTVARVRALAPGVSLDDRVGRPGFVAGLALCSGDLLDVALHLVNLAHRAELRAG